MPESRIDRRALARSFDRASRGYDAVARLQAQVRSELLDRLQYVKVAPSVVLDLGAGTGHATRELRRRYPRALVIAADIAPGMLRVARAQSGFLRRFERLCADAYRLPFAAGSVDLLFSSLMLQWCDDLDAVLAEIRRVVKPGGVFTFSTFGPDTLLELRSAWAQVDGRVHVNQFLDMHDVGDALGRAGFADPVLDVDRHRTQYREVRELMRDLKALGAHNVAAERARGLTGRTTLERLTAAYEVRRHDGTLPATYEVIYGTAWGAPPRPAADASGETTIPVSRLGRRARSSQ